MQHIQGISRHQLQVCSLEDKIASDNSVRFIEAFVGFIDLKKLGFELKTIKTEVVLFLERLSDNGVIIIPI